MSQDYQSILSKTDEVIFTSGGTESNNLAILGVINFLKEKGAQFKEMHCVTSTIEHSSVLDVFHEIEKGGSAVSYVGVDKNGILNLDEFKKALRPNTALVSIIYASNEIGTIQSLPEIAKIVRNFRKGKPTTFPIVHTDASQAPSYLDINEEKLGVDLMTLDGQKIYGPKGVGVLYKRENVFLKPLFFGGKQEYGLRPGTENVPGIVGFAKALELVIADKEKEINRLTDIRDHFVKNVLEKIPQVELNGDPKKRLPNNVNLSFPGYDNEWLVLQLDAKGIAVGTRSACLTGEESSSYVIRALGESDEYAKSSVRFTLGKETTKEDMNYVIDELFKIINY